MTPRMTGSRKTRCRAIGELIDRLTSAMSPFGLRTATAQFEGPRIITPSSTACPPIEAAMGEAGLHARRGAAGALEPALEALDAAAGVHQLLLARVERVAVRADLDVELGLRRARLERVPAGARDGREDVLGMDAGLHRRARIAEAVSVRHVAPETTARPSVRAQSGTFPASSAAAAAAPAGSQASLARA